MTAPGKAKTPARRSLNDFVKAKRREGCKVCALGAPLIEQMREARRKKIARTDVVEWLKDDYGIDLTNADLDSHNNGRHDE